MTSFCKISNMRRENQITTILYKVDTLNRIITRSNANVYKYYISY